MRKAEIYTVWKETWAFTFIYNNDIDALNKYSSDIQLYPSVATVSCSWNILYIYPLLT
jgi:hypothetical protein